MSVARLTDSTCSSPLPGSPSSSRLASATGFSWIAEDSHGRSRTMAFFPWVPSNVHSPGCFDAAPGIKPAAWVLGILSAAKLADTVLESLPSWDSQCCLDGAWHASFGRQADSRPSANACKEWEQRWEHMFSPVRDENRDGNSRSGPNSADAGCEVARHTRWSAIPPVEGSIIKLWQLDAFKVLQVFPIVGVRLATLLCPDPAGCPRALIAGPAASMLLQVPLPAPCDLPTSGGEHCAMELVEGSIMSTSWGREFEKKALEPPVFMNCVQSWSPITAEQSCNSSQQSAPSLLLESSRLDCEEGNARGEVEVIWPDIPNAVKDFDNVAKLLLSERCQAADSEAAVAS